MNKYIVVNSNTRTLPFQVMNANRQVVATFKDEARANRCAAMMNATVSDRMSIEL